METIFKNQYTVNRDYYNEYYFNNIVKNKSLIITSGIWISFLAGEILLRLLISAETVLLSPNYLPFSLFLTFILFPCLWLTRVFRYQSAASQRCNQLREAYGQDYYYVNIEIDANSIRYSDSNSPYSIYYPLNFINKVKKSQNYIILLTKAKNAIYINKKGFLQGDSELFLDYLRRKGIQC